MKPGFLWKYLTVGLLVMGAVPLAAQDQTAFKMTPMITDLDTPWGLAL